MSEAATQYFEIFSKNFLVSICGAVLILVKKFNRPPENQFNNRQYTTHIEQFIESLRQFMCLYFLYKNEFFTISGNPQSF